jgi:uncharacterized ferritin-like protein (DUF455 family)
VTRASLPPETPIDPSASSSGTGPPDADSPAPRTLEAWALAYVTSDRLADKLSPSIPPEAVAGPEARANLGPAPARPGRPSELLAARKAAKTPGKDALREPSKRAQILHTFFHHELQAAELFAWAILAYPDADSGFRRGVARLLLDEARHMRLYRERIQALGYDIGAFPVRDWFWNRVPSATTPTGFVATLGLGFEGGYLDHAARFAERFAAVGDEESAALQRRVAREEEPHVRFALRWFEKFTGAVTYAGFAEHLPPPLTPGLMRGKRLETEARLRAGFPAPFLEELAACPLV